MGGLGPGIGGMEYVVIAIVALLVVGPERLPAMLQKLGKMIARARNMAGEFRASFDEMARASELDELRKEVDALRQNQMVPLGAEADAAFREIRDDLNTPLNAPASPALLTAPDEWPDANPTAVLPDADVKPKTAKAKAATKPTSATTPVAGKPKAKAAATKAPVKAAVAKPRTPRAKTVDL